jgi:DNA-binding CsgD family transcriptional regulator
MYFSDYRLLIKLGLLIVLNGFLVSSFNAQTAQIKNFTKQDYQAASQNWSVTFNKEGLAYFGNNLGLLEFDGVTWSLYSSPNGTIIRAVAIAKDNRIFTGGYRELGYWEKDTEGILRYNSLASLVEDQFTKDEEFWNIFVLKEKVYFHSFSGIFIYDSGKFEVIKPGFVNYAVKSNDKIYFSIKDKGIYKISGNSFTIVTESSFFINKTIRFISENTNNGLLIGTESNGLFFFDNNTKEIKPWQPSLEQFFIENKINHGMVLSDNKLIIGTILAGVVVIDSIGAKMHHLEVENGLQSNTVLGLAEDKFGNIWLALDKGIDYLSFLPSDTYYSIKDNSIGAVYTAALYNNHLYVGTNQGLYKKNLANKNTSFNIVKGTQEQVWDCQIINNTLFVGHNLGTFAIKNKEIEKISDYSGGYSIIRFPHNQDMLIQCTYSHLVVYKKIEGTWTYSHTIDDFNNLIRHLAFDHLNNLWASHLYHGVYKIVLNDELTGIKNMKHYGKNSVLGKYHQNINVFKVENRIVFTTNKKLYTYDDLNDSIIPYDFLNNHLNEFASSFRIISAPEHRYWFINKKGIACFEINHDGVKKINEYPIALFENQLVQKYENVVPLSKEEALVCLENGYIIINTASTGEGDAINSQKLYLKEILIRDKYDNSELISASKNNLAIPYAKNNLNLRYSFPYYSGNKVLFQYKIEGLDNKWSDPMEKPIVTIKRIPPGSYKLIVKAVNSWGKFSQISEFKFMVNPPWYRTNLAYFSYAVFFVILVLFSRYLTIKRVKLKEKRKRLQKERELIQLRNEKLRDEISFKSQQLASSTMGIIKKNEFLMSLKKKLKSQKDSLGTRYPDKYYQSIVKKIDENISGQDDWNIFEANFVKAHETFLKNLKQSFPDLTPSDLRLCAYLRINLTSKEIAPLLGISVRGVENHRYRLRKKLNLASDENLTEFILSV